MPEDEPATRAWDVPDEQIVRSSGGRGGHGLDAAEVLRSDDDFTTPALPRHMLVFNLGTAMEATDR
ncbi:MAG: hypothetical protein AVDCRST_MAG88-3311 [uncultured Thermomicrobiales bacterium]|uniref:Uncharacterized protein n=1 Tax=uncultured Thermomicrobiales bacterium TaxID=1645740 RepID=A0A6J4VIW8_9BACT|nr:MAG: hypothetical protein AVDCRST_MAG88-3311 [uncultured Thermomicrobiales bacterium]